MKYYLCENKNGSIVFIKEITKKEHLVWVESVEQVEYYTLANNFRDIAINNGLEITKYLKNISNISDVEVIKTAKAKEIGIEANRLMLNYLVSFRTYVDNLQAYAKYIKNGDDFKNNILKYIYDTEPAYSFLYKLRNFATHYSMVFDSISIENGKLYLQCSKEHLQEYSEWNIKNKTFLDSCDDFLPILDFVEHNNVLIMSIYLGFLQYFADDIQEIHNNLMSLMKQYQVINPLFVECESIYGLEGANVFGLALEVLKDATDELSNFPNVNISFLTPEQVLNNE